MHGAVGHLPTALHLLPNLSRHRRPIQIKDIFTPHKSLPNEITAIVAFEFDNQSGSSAEVDVGGSIDGVVEDSVFFEVVGFFYGQG